MKIAIIGSRGLCDVRIEYYIPKNTSEIISGGARGIDSVAAEYARARGIKLTEILPRYDRYGRAAPILRNEQIVDAADMVLAFWDGSSRGTLSVIEYAKSCAKPIEVIICK